MFYENYVTGESKMKTLFVLLLMVGSVSVLANSSESATGEKLYDTFGGERCAEDQKRGKDLDEKKKQSKKTSAAISQD